MKVLSLMEETMLTVAQFILERGSGLGGHLSIKLPSVFQRNEMPVRSECCDAAC